MSDRDDELRTLVEMAAAGQLSASEVAEVEALVADHPHLRSELARLRTPTQPDPRKPDSSGLGCLLPIVAAVVAAVVVITVAVFARGGNDDEPTNPVAAVLDDPNQVVLALGGPEELTAFGRLALTYSPAQRKAVLLGEDIPTAGKLVADDDTGSHVVVEFAAGQVFVLIDRIDPEATFTIEAVP